VAPRRRQPLALGLALAGTGLAGWLALGTTGAPPARTDPRPPALAATGASRALTDEAIRLYASGQFARACERFREAATRSHAGAGVGAEVGRCFEGWGWQSLREGRASEAVVLFEQGLAETPDAPGLLKGLGVASVHAGRPEHAVPALERAARAEDDPQVRLLLAHLYDRRDEGPAALDHLRAVLAREPEHPGARRLLDKLERERRAEAGFDRELSEHFALRSGPGGDARERRRLLDALERAHEDLAARLGFRPAERITVVLYDAAAFQTVTGVHGWASGVFDGKIRLPLAGTAVAGRDVERLVLHEYTHAAIHGLSRGRAPRWLHEGLAQVMEGATVDPLLRVPGQPTLAGVEALVTDPDPARARAGYDLALWIVSDLLDRGGMERLREVLGELGEGRSLGDAMTRAYGLRLAELETQWRRLLGG
jgi:tetratricopeptide (TPR) repeat protein